MIRFHALGTRFSLPLLSLLTPLLALRLGHSGGLGAIALALGCHEAGHIIAARIAGVPIREIQLTPFGGSARMENPYRLSAARIIPVAAAGPAANLLLALFFAASVHWRILSPLQASPVVNASLVLFLFNLLPALPLDGGRILFALLQRPLGEKRALTLGIWMGRLLAAALFGVALAAGLRYGSWNLSFFLAAIFIIASEPDERRALFNSQAQRIPDLMDGRAEALPVRIFQMDASHSLHQALSQMRPNEASWFILTRNGRPCALLDGNSILRHLISTDAPDALLGSLQAFAIIPQRTSGASLNL